MTDLNEVFTEARIKELEELVSTLQTKIKQIEQDQHYSIKERYENLVTTHCDYNDCPLCLRGAIDAIKQ